MSLHINNGDQQDEEVRYSESDPSDDTLSEGTASKLSRYPTDGAGGTKSPLPEDDIRTLEDPTLGSLHETVYTARPRYARSAISQSEADFADVVYDKTRREKVNDIMQSKPVALFFMGLIIASTLAFLLETVPELSSDPDYGNPDMECFWFCLETTFIVFFTLEYAVRWASANYPLSFPFEVFNIVDLVAILPYYVEILAKDSIDPCGASTVKTADNEGNVVDLRFIRVIRLARVFRVLKLSRRTSATTVLVQTFQNSIDALMVPFFFLLLGMVVFASLIYLAEQGDYDPDDRMYYVTDSQGHRVTTFFVSIPDALWWALVTMSTVGYGDMYPRTAAGKAINSFAMIFGILFFAMPIAIVGNEFTKAWEEKKKRDIEAGNRQQAIISDAEKSKLEANTAAWGEKELKHFRIYFDESNITLEDFMGVPKNERHIEGTRVRKKIRPSKDLIPEHFNWGLFGKEPNAKKIALQLGTSDFFLNAPESPKFTGEYRRLSKTKAIWEKKEQNACFLLESKEGHWVVHEHPNTGTYLQSEKRHGGSLPSLKTQWMLVDTRAKRKSNAKLAGERRDLVIKKQKDTHIDNIEFRDTDDGVILVAADTDLAKGFIGRKVLSYNTVTDLLEGTYTLTFAVLLFAPRFVADTSLLDLANKVFHIFRTQRQQGAVSEKNTQMYSKDFVVQLYHHLGYARLPTGFRSKAGLKIVCGSETQGGADFIFSSDSDLGVFGLGPGSVVPVYCMANQAKNMNDPERKGSIGGELLALAQNFYLNADRSRSQRVFLATYRGTDVRFYSAFFPAEYLDAMTQGQHKDQLDPIAVLTYPNRGDGGGVPGYPDTIRTRNDSNETTLRFAAGTHLELDAMDNPLRLLSIDPITQSGTGLKPGMRIHELNGVPVHTVSMLGVELAKAAENNVDIKLKVSVEHDALDFLNPSERVAITTVLQRIRLNIIKYLQEDLDENLAFAPISSPRIRDMVSMASCSMTSRHLSALFERQESSRMSEQGPSSARSGAVKRSAFQSKLRPMEPGIEMKTVVRPQTPLVRPATPLAAPATPGPAVHYDPSLVSLSSFPRSPSSIQSEYREDKEEDGGLSFQ